MTIAIISMIREPWGGSEELWYDMAKSALAEGHKIIHLRFEHPTKSGKIRDLETLGAMCYTRPGYIPENIGIPERFLRTGMNFIRKKTSNIFPKIARQKPDLVLYNGTCYSIAREKELVKWLNTSGLPFYILGHLNSDSHKEIGDAAAATLRDLYKRAEKVLFVSQRSIATAERHLSTYFTNTKVIRNPVNLQEPEYLPFPNPVADIQMAIVGNLVCNHKGHDILIEALSKVSWVKENWRLNIYGSGQDEQYLRNLALHFGLKEKIVFHGRVQDVKQIWQTNQLLLLPSHMEGMPLAVVEAMLCGRPSLVTDVGGNSEWIEHGSTGWIAPAATVSLISRELESVWVSRVNWAEMGRLARKKAMELYDPKAGATLLEVLKRKNDR